MIRISYKVAAFIVAFTIRPHRGLIYAFLGYEVSRYITQRVIMILLFPLQSQIMRCFQPSWRRTQLDKTRALVANRLQSSGYQVEHVGLKINGAVYSALKISHPDNQDNRWVLQATGNGEPIEYSACDFAIDYKAMGLNVLLVRGQQLMGMLQNLL